MADGRDPANGPGSRKAPSWTHLFRCFSIALDPKKLVAAAAGILVMSLGWWLLSKSFYYDKPDAKAPAYSDAAVLAKEFSKKIDGTPYTDEERVTEGVKKYERDLAQWKVLDDLAGPNGGRLRTMPWFEYRGENPYLFATNLSGKPTPSWFDECWVYLKSQIPVLAEPLFKLLLPVIKIVDANASPQTRIYLVLILLWSVVTWAFFGGIITRIAAVQLSGKDRITIGQAVTFVCSRYKSYVFSPIVPLGVVAAVTLGLIVLGLICLIPIVGDVIYGIGMPLVILGGLMMAILIVGLVGYPLMYPTISVEGSDTFDALSRSYNYVFQAPWQYLRNASISLVYGVAVTFVVVLIGSFAVYLGKWAITQTPLSESTNQRPDYLFVYAPETYGWKELLLRGSDLEVKKKVEIESGRVIVSYPPADEARAKKYKESYQFWNQIGAGLTAFWLVFILLLVLGFGYSFFWSSATVIYLLMRESIDDTELDEVYLEEQHDPLPLPPTPAPVTPAVPSNTTSLPVVPASPPVTPPTVPMQPPPAPPVVPPAVPPAPPTAPPEYPKA